MNDNSEKEIVQHRRRSGIAWGLTTGILALALIGLAWYVYPRLRQQNAAIDALRAAQNAFEQAKAAAVSPASTVADRSAADEQMRDRLAKLERKLQRNFEARVASVRKQAHEASDGAFQRAQALVDMQVHSLEARLSRMESSSAAEDTRVAELRTELGKMHQQLAEQASELQTVQRQVDATAATGTRSIADLKRGEEHDRSDVDSVADSLAMQRVDFETTKHHTSEPAPGIYLHIDRADPSFSNVDGWMRVMPADRMFWLHRQNVQEPVAFYGANDKTPCQLVLTGTRGTSVKGYLLLPAPHRTSQIARANLNH